MWILWKEYWILQSYYFLVRGGCEVAETGFEAVNVDFIPQTYLRTNNGNDDRCQAQCPKESFFIPSPYNIIYRSGKILADKVLTKIPGFISNINSC